VSKIDARLPHSLELERAYLGGLILGGEGFDLEVSDFFLPFHKALYAKLLQLRRDGKPTNDLALIAEALDARELEEVGGISYLAGLLDGIPRASNLSHYSEVLKQKSLLRKAIARSQLNTDKLWAANGDTPEVLREVFDSFRPYRGEVGQKRILTFKTGAALTTDRGQMISWLAKGLVAKGGITELGAKVKTGKTTLVLAMVRAVLDGEPFLGLPTFKTPVVYLTEQPTVSFRQAMERADLLDREDFLVLPYSETIGIPWAEVAAAATKECKRAGASLLAVDTLGQFAGLTGDKENNSGDALEAMSPLQAASAEGIGVIVVRHERKSGGDVGDSGRGSSAFAGVVDVVLSLRKAEGNAPKARRVLQSLSRFSETPSDLVIEMTDAGYVALGDAGETAVNDAKKAILAVAPQTETEAIDLKELSSNAEVSRQSAQRAIAELTEEGMLSRIGRGKRGDAFRYFLKEIRFCPTSNIEVGRKTQ